MPLRQCGLNAPSLSARGRRCQPQHSACSQTVAAKVLPPQSNLTASAVNMPCASILINLTQHRRVTPRSIRC